MPRFLNVTEPDSDYQSPELFSHAISSGETLYGMVFKPTNMVPRKKYPVVLSVYGGPEVQLVSNTFKASLRRNAFILNRIYSKTLDCLNRAVGRSGTTYWPPRAMLLFALTLAALRTAARPSRPT